MLEFVEELLNSQNNIIDQLKLLKENKKHKEVKKYIKALLKMNLSPYVKYCIDKYYFDLDVEEVKPTAKNRHITLYNIYFPSLLKKQEKERARKYIKNIKNVKIGDTIKILDGPFGGMIGKVKTIDKAPLKIVVMIKMFDIDTPCECSDRFEIIKENNNEKKN